MATVYDIASVIIPQGGGYKAGTLYGWNPQTENTIDFSVVRATTATRVNSAGLIESVAANVPRWDWAEGLSCPSLLIEPQRTNLITYSEQLDNAAWQKLNSTVSADATISPDGTTNADKLVEDGLTAEHIIRSSAISITSGNTYILSVFAKQGERSIIRMGADDQGNLPGRAFFDLSAGTVGTIAGGASASIEALSNGWYRCTLITTASGSVGGVNMEVNLATAGETVNYLGDGSSGAFLFGGQIEVGSYATSYIPTSGSQVTRNADVISKTSISSLLGQSSGTIYAELAWFENNNRGIALSDGSTTNRTTIYVTPAGTLTYLTQVGGVTQAQISAVSITNKTTYKIAVRYATNDFAICTNGTINGTDTSGITFGSGVLTSILLTIGGVGNDFYGRIKGLSVLPELTNAELQTLTS